VRSPRPKKVIPLEPAPLFKAGHSEPLAGVDRLARSLEDESPKKGDILLLLGSADCTRYSKSNRQLALERAARISDELGPSLHGARVEDRYVLAQHGDGCKENMDLRSVFSFLIQQQETSK
jgi:hypothetical protein